MVNVRRCSAVLLSAAWMFGGCGAPETPIEPRIGLVTPACGPTSGGNTIGVRGEGFEDGMQIRFGSAILETTFVDDRRLEATVPASTTETVPIAVVNAAGEVEAARTMAYRFKDPETFDPNGDCGVSAADIHYLSNYLAGSGNPPVLSGDADGDGDVDDQDVEMLVQFLFAGGEGSEKLKIEN